METLDFKKITETIKASHAPKRLNHELVEAHAPGDLPLCFPGRGPIGATGAEYNIRYRPLGMLEQKWSESRCIESGLILAWYKLGGYLGPKDNEGARAILRDAWSVLTRDQLASRHVRQLRATAAFMFARSKAHPCVELLKAGGVWRVSTILSPYGAYVRSLRAAVRFGSRSAILEYQLLGRMYRMDAVNKAVVEKFKSGHTHMEGIGLALLHVCVWMPTFWYVAWTDERLSLRRDRCADMVLTD